MTISKILFATLVVSIWMPTAFAAKSAKWMAGFAKVNVNPTEPTRLSGYGNRDRPSEGVDTPLFVRCVALRQTNQRDADASVLITVDTVGMSGVMTKDLATQLRRDHGLPRSHIVFSCTHTHTAPDLLRPLGNLFSAPLTEAERAAAVRYRAQLRDGILKSVAIALRGMAPARIAAGSGEVQFAVNRRVLKDGRWTGFGVQPDGPVDHSVPVLRFSDPHGKVRGIIFNYACHCTTIDAKLNRVNADWAGYACDGIEQHHPGAVALCTIGCGADANPNPRKTVAFAKMHGRDLAAEVLRVSSAPMRSIDQSLEQSFDFAALAFDLPTTEELKQRLETGRPQDRRHAEYLLEIYARKNRLPASYPVPIQAWQFGDQLTMVFLGGEVVVDYALRLKRQLESKHVWVTAYANDVLGYIASERMRSEGGYEFDRSGVYYGLPGPWASGTEDRLVQAVERLIESKSSEGPVSADQALSTIHLSEPYEIQLVASEPLVQDPINIAFDADGSLWVVEMGGYPENESGGRIKRLRDSDHDGVFDVAELFYSALTYPTGVHPWNDGVLITAAPDLLFAKDTTGDGRADSIETLCSGFPLSNPQHRISGIAYGLDHSMHLSSGDNLDDPIIALRTGKSIDASGCDLKIYPDTGEIEATSGRTQYLRSRNDWGEWFGNSNSHPMFHFPIDIVLLDRNPAARYADVRQMLFDPPVAPPVFPSRDAGRFNDLYSANRFTSACSAVVARAPAFSGGEHDALYVCEPVHNLVHRSILRPHGATYRAERFDDELDHEFLTSTDGWFRPVRVVTGTDGALWIVDMYRQTIEHPKWIPDAWQEQLDLRAGENRGRIYRVTAKDQTPDVLPNVAQWSSRRLIESLHSPIGPLRDLAQRLVLHRGDADLEQLRKLAGSRKNPPHARVHALSILDHRNQLNHRMLVDALGDTHFGVLMAASRLAARRLAMNTPDSDQPFSVDRISDAVRGEVDRTDQNEALMAALAELSDHPDLRVVRDVALALGESKSPTAGQALAGIAARGDLDAWTADAISSSSRYHARQILDRILRSGELVSLPSVTRKLLANLFATVKSEDIDVRKLYGEQLSDDRIPIETRVDLASILLSASGKQNKKLSDLNWLAQLYQHAVELVSSDDLESKTRCSAMGLIGLGLGPILQERELLVSVLSPATPPQVQQTAIDRLLSLDDESIDQVLEHWPEMSRSLREHCVQQLLTYHPRRPILLDAIESEKIAVRDLSAAARQRIRQAGDRSMKVRAARLISFAGTAEKRQLVENYLAAIDGPADVGKGRELFQKHCATCHDASGNEQPVGASLDNLSDRRDRPMLQSILDPNRAVDPQFQSYLIETSDGRVVTGAIIQETASSLTLGQADGKQVTIARSDIESMKNSGVSLMPEGFEEILSPTDLRNVIGYLRVAGVPQERIKVDKPDAAGTTHSRPSLVGSP